MQSCVSGTKKLTAVTLTALLTGCISVQAIEPVIEPPQQFRFDTATSIEFVHPSLVGLRCAERGATFFGLPALNSGACADMQLITMIDPCQTFTAGAFARILCIDYLEVNEAAGNGLRKVNNTPNVIRIVASTSSRDDDKRRAGVRRIDFRQPAHLGDACREQEAPLQTDDGIPFCSTDDRVLIANPCALYARGWYERALCHELAHVNGWAPDHSGGHPRVKLARANTSPEALLHARLGSPALPKTAH